MIHLYFGRKLFIGFFSRHLETVWFLKPLHTVVLNLQFSSARQYYHGKDYDKLQKLTDNLVKV